MKIVILADAWYPLVGGGQKLFSQVIKGLISHHHCQVTVITRKLKPVSKSVITPYRLIRLGPAAKWSNPLARIWFTLQSAVYAVKLKPDVFLASTFLPGLSLQLIKLLNKTPQVLLVIGFGATNFIYRWLETFITQKLKYDLLITDDFNFFQKVKDSKKVKLIFNGVSIPKNQVLAKWPDFTFLFVGRNEVRKGAYVLKQAFKKLKQTHPQAKLRFIGPGFKLVSNEQLHQELFQAHCLVLPSLREGHPLIIFEAWAHKLPVIATNVGSVSQFVNNNNGYLISSNDPDELTSAMQQALANPKLNQLGESGYNLVAKQFSWNQTVDKYYQALKTLT